MTLKASELSQAMVSQLPTAWSQIKGTSFPGGDTKDAEVMFRAVALGLISYLQQAAGQGALNTINTDGVGPLSSLHVTSVAWNTDLT
jgi:hypothetical protein